MTKIAPIVALSHGGGPMPILGDKDHETIIYSLKNRVPKLLGLGTSSQPRAIVLVTAHWSTEHPTVSSAEKHDLLYDYGGFPRAAYELKYPAPGDPGVAREVQAALAEEGLKGQLDAERGWDHGVFVPMTLVHPVADVPIVQMSVLRSEDPDAHLKMGRALSRLRASNIAIVGSGFASFHNLRIMMQLRGGPPSRQAEFKKVSDEWNAALTAAVTLPGREERWAGLRGWRGMANADTMHPPGGGEHFMPLVVCAGAAGDGERAGMYRDEFVGTDIWTYYWGAELEEGE